MLFYLLYHFFSNFSFISFTYFFSSMKSHYNFIFHLISLLPHNFIFSLVMSYEANCISLPSLLSKLLVILDLNSFS